MGINMMQLQDVMDKRSLGESTGVGKCLFCGCHFLGDAGHQKENHNFGREGG